MVRYGNIIPVDPSNNLSSSLLVDVNPTGSKSVAYQSPNQILTNCYQGKPYINKESEKQCKKLFISIQLTSTVLHLCSLAKITRHTFLESFLLSTFTSLQARNVFISNSYNIKHCMVQQGNATFSMYIYSIAQYIELYLTQSVAKWNTKENKYRTQHEIN